MSLSCGVLVPHARCKEEIALRTTASSVDCTAASIGCRQLSEGLLHHLLRHPAFSRRHILETFWRVLRSTGSHLPFPLQAEPFSDMALSQVPASPAMLDKFHTSDIAWGGF